MRLTVDFHWKVKYRCGCFDRIFSGKQLPIAAEFRNPALLNGFRNQLISQMGVDTNPAPAVMHQFPGVFQFAFGMADCPDIQEPAEFFDWFQYPTPVEMEKAVRNNFLISGWVAVRQLEYANQGTIILVTRKENIELANKAGVEGVSYPLVALLALGRATTIN